MGSKAKFWFEHTELGPCLFKAVRPGTGEDWSEKVSAEVAGLIGLPHAQYELALSSGERGVVTPRITNDRERLVHGNEILIEIDPDYEARSAEYLTPAHTVDAVLRAVGESEFTVGSPPSWTPPDGVQDAVGLITGYLFLDALYSEILIATMTNLGTIETQEGTDVRYALAPTFHHASCLGRN